MWIIFERLAVIIGILAGMAGLVDLVIRLVKR
jgi:hypothetical protein